MLKKTLVTSIILLAFTGRGFATDGDEGRKWAASWATSSATFFTYVPPVPPAPPGPPVTFAPANIQPDLAFPFPAANTLGASDQTIRSIVKPDLWGNKIRIRFSNVFGTQPLTFDSVTVGLQEYSANVVKGTMTAVTFGGQRRVTIPVGQEVFSDGVLLSWVAGPSDPSVQGRTAITRRTSTSSHSSSPRPPGSSSTTSMCWPTRIRS